MCFVTDKSDETGVQQAMLLRFHPNFFEVVILNVILLSATFGLVSIMMVDEEVINCFGSHYHTVLNSLLVPKIPHMRLQVEVLASVCEVSPS